MHNYLQFIQLFKTFKDTILNQNNYKYLTPSLSHLPQTTLIQPRNKTTYSYYYILPVLMRLGFTF
jgi:hypothetical protein